jgi:aspartate/tyrosine/aromatic aminotransferase
MEPHMTTFFQLPNAEEDPILGLQLTYKKDLRPDKKNLSIGLLMGKEGLYRFQAIKKAEELFFQTNPGYQYLPIDGLASFRKAATDLLFPQKAASYVAQTVGGTAALHVGGKLIFQHVTKQLLLPEPTWINHKKLFEPIGFQIHTCAYETAHGTLNVEPLLQAIDRMKEGSCIILQASCHNPTGIDPTEKEWRTISHAIKKKKMIPFFDMAYQGLGKGIDEDAAAIRLFVEEGHEVVVALSFSKNFGLYSERVGALAVVSRDSFLPAISSQVRGIIRSLYSSPSSHGASLVATLWESPELKTIWEKELAELRQGLQEKRTALALLAPKKQKEAILNGTGLFAMTGLPSHEIGKVRQEKGIYLCDDGRINIAAIQPDELKQIATSIYR